MDSWLTLSNHSISLLTLIIWSNTSDDQLDCLLYFHLLWYRTFSKSEIFRRLAGWIYILLPPEMQLPPPGKPITKLCKAFMSSSSVLFSCYFIGDLVGMGEKYLCSSLSRGLLSYILLYFIFATNYFTIASSTLYVSWSSCVRKLDEYVVLVRECVSNFKNSKEMPTMWPGE